MRTQGGEDTARSGREHEDTKKTTSPSHNLLASPSLLLFLTWLLVFPALTPLIQPTLTRSADGLLHLYRLVALDHLIHQGVFFARWWPDLAYGYGLPLFVFYAPLSYYLTEIFHLLGLSAVASFNASAALALLVAATGVYLLVKDWFGPLAGMLAGVTYVYAPYQLFNIFLRGSLPVTWALALFPLTFWALRRLVQTGRPVYLPLSALTLGAALLAHNISSLLFLPLLIFYLTVDFFFTFHPSTLPLVAGQAVSRFTFHDLLRVVAALILGLALTAFFWLPANLEREYAQTYRVVTPPDFDYHSNFVNLSQLFSFPPPANTGLLNPGDPLTLGLTQVALAATGLLFWSLSLNQQKSSNSQFAIPVLFFTTISLVITIFMMLPLSAGVWDRLPLIAFVQQPHRLLSVTAFLLALLGGAAVATLPGRLSLGLTVTGSILIVVSAVPLLYPRYYNPLPADPTLTGMLTYEHAGGAIGTTSFGEYLPIWVQQVPRESPLEPLYQAGTTIERLDRTYLPAAATVETARYGVNQMEITFDSPLPFQAVFHTFYFPGWQARVDGQSAAIAPVTERGLIGVTVPAGRHHVSLYFGETPVRQVANGISALALITIIVLSVRTLNVQRSTLNSLREPSTFNLQRSTFNPTFQALTILALSLLLTKALYLDRFDNPLKHVFDGTQVAGAAVSRRINFGHQVNLLGYDLGSTTVASGQTFDLTVYWQARQPLATNYSALAQLVDDRQHLYAGQDNLHPGNLPATRWEPWGFVQDRHAVRVPAGTPPGDYFLVTGLYDPATWIRLPVLEGGAPGWNDVMAVPVTVTRPAHPPEVGELGIVWLMPDQTFEVSKTSKVLGIRLLGATPEREIIQRNDFLRMVLFWEATAAPAGDYQTSLRLLAGDGTVALVETSPPSFGRYPTSHWTAGERIRDNYALWIPADFPAGTYHIQMRLLDEKGQSVGNWLELGQVTAEAN